ncbi:MAG: alpha/beta hydrolase [Armatimonadota bacterium]
MRTCDLRDIPPDLTLPPICDGEPAPGRRVKRQLPEYRETEVHHLLYLPEDWRPGGRYPVIVEYPGNGPVHVAPMHDYSSGLVEDCPLGYGISAGRGCIWAALPFVSADGQRNQGEWWGDAEATVRYCLDAVREICAGFGGDTDAVILAGFSRGALACNYIGLRHDEIAGLWRAFIAHSHYDGVKAWVYYPDSDRASALTRLQRLHGRPVFVSHELSTAETREYLATTGVAVPFTFLDLPYPNHRADWVLRPITEREMLREWVRDCLSGDCPRM